MKKITISPVLLLLFTLVTLHSFSQENTALTCADGIDNDNDTLIDCLDPDCQNIGNSGCEVCTDATSFADTLIEYVPGCTLADEEPEGALGVSDYDGVSAASNYVFLGQGGSIKLGFTNNVLTNSGDSEFDVYIFEVGPDVEASNIAIRPANAFTETQLINNNIPDADNDGFFEVGSIQGSTRGFDIDDILSGFAVKTLQFNAIQIQDIPNGSCGGSSPGADIDAVCALSSFTLSASENIYNENFVKVYPNPTEDKINLQFGNDNHDLVNYALINLYGQILQNGFINNKTEIHVKNLESGIYFLSIKGKARTITKKIFKL